MKKLMAMLLLAGSIQGVYAQKTEKKEMFLENKSLYEELTNVQKKTDKFTGDRLDHFHRTCHYHSSSRNFCCLEEIWSIE